jgi:Fic family protein
MGFNPKYTVTPKILKALSRIEIARHDIIGLPITAALIASFRESARLASTHHSTAIEGNLLTPHEVQEVIKGGRHFPNRQKDEDEVRNYYRALEYVEVLAKQNMSIQEQDVKTLHGLSFRGRQNPTPYRDAQNVIRNGRLIVYIPPKAEDVGPLMRELMAWVPQALGDDVPIPFIAGLAHYQLATIHPYYDGNGRTARLLTTLILHKYGYDLKGIYSLEEYYARNLQEYYDALTVGDDEDYYEGNRNTADLTGFLTYFVEGMAESFDKICRQARNTQKEGNIDQSPILRNLSPQQRQALKLFISSKEITAKEIAHFFQYNDRQARYLCQKWVSEGFLEISGSGFKDRKYRLINHYEQLIQSQLPQ